MKTIMTEDPNSLKEDKNSLFQDDRMNFFVDDDSDYEVNYQEEEELEYHICIHDQCTDSDVDYDETDENDDDDEFVYGSGEVSALSVRMSSLMSTQAVPQAAQAVLDSDDSIEVIIDDGSSDSDSFDSYSSDSESSVGDEAEMETPEQLMLRAVVKDPVVLAAMIARLEQSESSVQ